MYSFSHFHSTSHEVLGIASGKARLCFGHEENAKRVEEVCEKGDVIVVPAGVSHRLLEDLDGGFSMVGSYPVGCNWDMCEYCSRYCGVSMIADVDASRLWETGRREEGAEHKGCCLVH